MSGRAKTIAALAAVILLLLGVAMVKAGPVRLLAVIGAVYVAAWLGYRFWSKDSTKSWLQKAALTQGSLLFALVMFELPVVLGIIDYRAIFHPPLAPMHDPGNVLDMELLFRRAPHTHVLGDADGGDFGFMFHTEDSERLHFDAKFDADGFRNPEGLEQADIVFIGDSFTEALPVATDQVVSSRLAKTYGVTVANYGMMTYGPSQELAVLKRYALPLKPKVVVWLFFEGNDLGDVTYYEWATKDLPGLHARYHGVLHRTLTMNLPRTLYHVLRVFKPSGYERSGLTPVSGDGGATERIYFLHQPKPLTEKNERALKRTAEIMAEAAALCEQAGVRLVVGLIPTKFRVYHDRTQFEDDAIPKSWQNTEVMERMAAIVRGLPSDVVLVDFLEPLREAASVGRRPYYRVDSHWNATGHEVASEVLHEAIGPLAK